MSVATQKGWQSDQRGWLPALFITAVAHAGILLQVDGDLLASRTPDAAPLLSISLVTAPVPAKPVPAITPPPPPAAENVDELGDLGLTEEEEAAIVAYLKTFTDNYPVWGKDPAVPRGMPSPYAETPFPPFP